MESGNDLNKISCPALILQGEHDSMTERQQKEMAERIPESKMVYIKKAHHATNLDNPKQVNYEIMEHLSAME